MRVAELFNFIQERDAIWWNRRRGQSKPWTSDKILQKYRFCNVYRERDTVTIWYADNWRQKHMDDPDAWFASLVMRFVNWPETCAELGYPVPFNPQKFFNVLDGRKARGEQVFNGAYIVSTNGVKIDKPSYITTTLEEAYQRRAELRWRGAAKDSLDSFHQRLMECNGVGSFLGAQVIADVKYCTKIYKEAHDWWSFAASGPGSRRGLSRVMGFEDYDFNWREAKWRESLAELMIEISPLVSRAGMTRLHAQDLQNCLCEFDKYERVRLGQGKPKARYNGKGD